MDDLDLEARLRTHLHRRSTTRTRRPSSPRTFARQSRRSHVDSARWACARSRSAGGSRRGRDRRGGSIGIGTSSGRAARARRPNVTRRTARALVRRAAAGRHRAEQAGRQPRRRRAQRAHSALGIGNFTSGGGYGIEFLLPDASPSDADPCRPRGNGGPADRPAPDDRRRCRKAHGVAGKATPQGRARAHRLGWHRDGRERSARRAPDLTITLKPTAAQAFGDYTTAHVGETFAIVAGWPGCHAPTVTEPITNGQLTIARTPDDAFAETAAILVGGELPEGVAWRISAGPDLAGDRRRRRTRGHPFGHDRGRGRANDGDLGPLGGLRLVGCPGRGASLCAAPAVSKHRALLVRVDA